MADDTQIKNPSLLPESLQFGIEDNKIVSISGYQLAGGGGSTTESDFVFYPTINNGNITFTLGTTAEHSDPIGPYYISGGKGDDGDDGFSPTIALTPLSPDPTQTHTQGGTQVDITYLNGGVTATATYTAWNGENGQGATVNLDEGNGIQITQNSNTYTIAVSADYSGAAVTSAKTWVGQQGYLSAPATAEDTYYMWDAENQVWKDADNLIGRVYVQPLYYDVEPAIGKYYGMSYDGDDAKWTEIPLNNYLPLSGGTVSGSTYFSAASGKNMVAVASAATLIGASRQTTANFGQNANALGTTWMGVGGAGMYRGFLKYTQGGDVGDLDSDNTMQVEFTPSNKGTIFAKAKNSGNDCPETQILNPTKASCDAMTQSANSNLVSGPNYMLAKNADGQFVIGAACVNCTAINDVTLAPNTYYFVYEV